MNCYLCNNKIKQNYIVNFLIFLSYIFIKTKKKISKNFFFLDKFSIYSYFFCRNCKIYQSEKVYYNNKKILTYFYGRNIIDKKIVQERKEFYLKKYNYIIELLKKKEKLYFLEISSDYGFLIEHLQHLHNCIGIEPEILPFKHSKKLNIQTYNILFNDLNFELHDDIKNTEWIHFSSSIRGIIPSELSKKIRLLRNLKTISISEVYSTNQNNIFSEQFLLYQSKVINYKIDNLKELFFSLGFKNFKLFSEDAHYKKTDKIHHLIFEK
jgi:hypothetical protein